jgi:hypothetical protein
MKVIAALSACAFFVCALTLPVCTETSWAAEPAKCSPLPTNDEIRRMSYSELYKWWKLSERASDLEAYAAATKQPITSCMVELSRKGIYFEQELKYR